MVLIVNRNSRKKKVSSHKTSKTLKDNFPMIHLVRGGLRIVDLDIQRIPQKDNKLMWHQLLAINAIHVN